MSDGQSPVPGWYDDPQNPAQLRWWNGTDWADQTRPKGDPVEATSAGSMPAQPTTMPPTGGAGMGTPVIQPYPGMPGMPMVPKDSGKATASLVLGILAMLLQCCCFPVILGIISIVLGQQAKTEIAASGGMVTGEGKVKAGLICSIIGLVLFALFTVLGFATDAFNFTGSF